MIVYTKCGIKSGVLYADSCRMIKTFTSNIYEQV